MQNGAPKAKVTAEEVMLQIGRKMWCRRSWKEKKRKIT